MANRVGFGTLVVGFAAVAGLLFMARSSGAQLVTSDRTAGYVVYPEIDVDTHDVFSQGRTQDTIIQLTNTASDCRTILCVYMNETKHCDDGSGTVCRNSSDCAIGSNCGLPTDCTQPERNFTLVLSAGQAVGWSAAQGATLPLETAECGGTVDFQTASAVQSGANGYFEGELKCFELAEDAAHLLNANDLKGEATVRQVSIAGLGVPSGLDVAAYNALGIQAVGTCTAPPGAVGTPCITAGQCGTDGACSFVDNTPQDRRCVGGTAQGVACTSDTTCVGGGSCEMVACLGTTPVSIAGALCPEGGIVNGRYAACPSVEVLDHFFDGAPNPVNGNPISTELTLVPCSEDLRTLTAPRTTTAQFLVYNEFEQRFSASTSVSCQKESLLSNLDVRPGQEASSIFSYGVQGTLTGQTRIRSVAGNEGGSGHGLIGVATESSGVTSPAFTLSSAAFNLNFAGSPARQADTVVVVP